MIKRQHTKESYQCCISAIEVSYQRRISASYQCCISTIEAAYQRCILARSLRPLSGQSHLGKLFKREHSWWIFVSDLTLLMK